MIIQSVSPVYRPDPNGLRIIEWTTTVDERSRKEYHHSRTWSIRLYNSLGKLQEYNQPNNIDVRA